MSGASPPVANKIMSKHIENTVFRSEEWQQKNGEGILELRGGELDIVLFVNGKPLVFHAHDCSGSLARFVVLFSENPLNAEQLISKAAANGFDADTTLYEQIVLLLPLFPNGDYRLSFEQLHDYNDPHRPVDFVYPPDWESGKQSNNLGYYPSSENDQALIGTQSEFSLDEETIDRYVTMINSGQRPALITVGLRHHWSRFIIDGHHKHAAYRRCNIGPVTLHIEFQVMKPISFEFAKHLLRHERYKNYLEEKIYQESL